MATQIAKSPASKIGVGDIAPDMVLTNSSGESIHLSETWADRPAALVFLRHFGCTFCREQVAMIRRDYRKLVDAGLNVVCVANGPYKVARAFEIYFDLPFPVLVSDDTAPFAAYGLERVDVKTLLTPRVVIRGFIALLHGHVQGRIIGDPMQLPGTFIVGTDGVIVFVHRNKDAADHTTAQMLLDAAPAPAAQSATP